MEYPQVRIDGFDTVEVKISDEIVTTVHCTCWVDENKRLHEMSVDIHESLRPDEQWEGLGTAMITIEERKPQKW